MGQQAAVGIQDGSGETPPDRPKKWLVTVVILGLLVTCSFVVLGVWLRLRQRRTGESPGQRPENPAVAFSCPDCGQKLKVRADRAGKKVRCGRCGEPVLVPESEA